MRGANRGVSKQHFSHNAKDESGEFSKRKKVGLFKGLISVWNTEDKVKKQIEKEQMLMKIYDLIEQIYKKHYGEEIVFNPELLENREDYMRFWYKMDQTYFDCSELKELIQERDYCKEIQKKLQSKVRCSIQLYILQGYDLSSRDIGTKSDPYLKITFGDTIFDERDNYQLDESNPKFNKMYQLYAVFPGAPSLKIEAYDYDILFGDDLIGVTSIDLDDRFFNPAWQELDQKPIEFRQIYHPSSALSQGNISMWLEIDDQVKKQKQKIKDKIWNLDAEPIGEYQIRVCVFDAVNIPLKDGEGTSDVYIRAYIDHKKKMSTDTHYRCKDGNASFNYRLHFDVQTPTKDCQLVLQAWDRDLFTPNDYICEWTMDLYKVLKMVQLMQQPIHLNKQFFEGNSIAIKEKWEICSDKTSLWLFTEKNGKELKIKLDIRIFPMAAAKASPNGYARMEPNVDPTLMPPVGRISFSWNPFRMLEQMMDKRLATAICVALCTLACIALLVMMAPMIGSNFISTFIIWAITPSTKMSK